jgi:acyl-CoA thioesterase
VGGIEMDERVERLIAGDSLIKLYGIEVEEASADIARVSAVVKEEFLQVHGVAHGAFVFTLIDVAFALNVNARSDAVAVQWSISQFRSGRLGEKLTAECRLLDGGGPPGHRQRGTGDSQGTSHRHSHWGDGSAGRALLDRGVWRPHAVISPAQAPRRCAKYGTSPRVPGVTRVIRVIRVTVQSLPVTAHPGTPLRAQAPVSGRRSRLRRQGRPLGHRAAPPAPA